jgi:DNA-binding beta-propeller fold protein YncE
MQPFRPVHSLLLLCLLAQTFEARAGEQNPPTPFLVVANKGDHTVGLVDVAAGRQVATVDAGGVTPHELAVSPDGRLAYAPIYGDAIIGRPGTDGRTLSVIDLAARKVVGTVAFGHGVRPHCAQIGPKDGLLYVTTELDKSVTLIDRRTLSIVGSVPTGQADSHMLALSRDGRRGYTANVGPGTVSVLDLVGRKTLAIIPVASKVQRIALSVDDKLAFTFDQTKPQMAVIDTSSNTVKSWVALPDLGSGAAATPDGRFLLVVLDGNQVGVVDLSALKVVRTLSVPASPEEILVRPDGAVAYVSCSKSRKVAVLRTADWTVTGLIDAGPGVDGLAWAAP